MSAMASQIIRPTIVYSTVYSRRRWKETLQFRVPGLCEGNSLVTDKFPVQRSSNAEHISIWWRHHYYVMVDQVHVMVDQQVGC